MKICCLSDLHGDLPEVPDCDLLLLAGDYCPSRKVAHWWYREWFAPWLWEAWLNRTIVWIAGNHDTMLEDSPNEVLDHTPGTYLQDSAAAFNGLKIYGTPWQPRFFDWAFNLDEPELAEKWAAIPNDTDILLLHGPPAGCGDQTSSGDRTGSPSLRQRILEVKPRLVVCGHIHESYGIHRLGDTVVVNAARMDERYRPINAPIVLELTSGGLTW